jgi:pantoate--beta-alanine ligase
MSVSVVFPTISGIRSAVTEARSEGSCIGLVPTMGALHEGHARLIEAARAESDFVVVSIFVNPTQFGPKEDFAKYPRTLDADLELCGKAGAAAIFSPRTEEIYPKGFHTFVEVEKLQDVLCGASRPGHFRGVCTVVLKLFNIVQPDIAFFGQKDAQQALIIKHMIRDLDVPVTIRTLPTLREPDGLAMSSRNRYLSADERQAAPALHRSLQQAEKLIAAGVRDPAAIERGIVDELSKIPGLRIDYVQALESETLERPAILQGPTLIALAAFLGATRLIDNIQIDVPASASR